MNIFIRIGVIAFLIAVGGVGIVFAGQHFRMAWLVWVGFSIAAIAGAVAWSCVILGMARNIIPATRGVVANLPRLAAIAKSRWDELLGTAERKDGQSSKDDPPRV